MALSFEKSNSAAFTVNTSKVAQGFCVNLSKSNPSLKSLGMRVVWKGDDFDISAVGFDSSDKPLLTPKTVTYNTKELIVPKYYINYQNLNEDGIEHGGDLVSSGDEEMEQINITHNLISSDVKTLLFFVGSHVEDKSSDKAVTFADVTDLEVQIVDLDNNEVVYTTELDTSKVGMYTSAQVAKLTITEDGLEYTPDVEGLGMEKESARNVYNKYYS